MYFKYEGYRRNLVERRDLRETIFETFMECKRTEILLNVLKFTSPY